MRLSSSTINRIGTSGLALLGACDPSPKNVGGGFDTDTTTTTAGGDDLADGSGTEGDASAPEWVHLAPRGVITSGMTGMSDGSVVLTEFDLESRHTQITRYSTDGTVLWQVDAGRQSIHDIETLPDGRLILGGQIDDGGLRAALWRLSPEGVVEAKFAHPLPGDSESNAHVMQLAASPEGVAYFLGNWGIEPGTPSRELWWSDFDLTPQWTWTDFEGSAEDIALLPNGELRTLEIVYGPGEEPNEAIMRSFASDGTELSDETLPEGRFADDQPLLQVGLSGEGVWIQGLEGTSALSMLLPDSTFGFNSQPIATHGPGLGVTAAVGIGDELLAIQVGPADLERETIIPLLSLDRGAPIDVVVAPDGSMFIGGYNVELSDEDGNDRLQGFMLKLPPP